ncbi:MAG: ABC transporter ATP-binding protein [SAR324 cluster bacterium]|nr:ABC transporter ATP-binding protein [SAR324 cluster bacterium]
MPDRPILELRDLQTNFYTRQGVAKAVDHVSYSVHAGETLAVVGESGCGKSVTSLSVLRLIPDPPGKIVGGSVLFEGEELTEVSDQRMREIRGNDISMIFQEPMSSLNPMMTIGNQISEALIQHFGISKKAAFQKAEEMLTVVHIPDAKKWLHGYPHEMSGGMCQRVMIAMAICCNPKILIADEPTTALDVTIQAQILKLMEQLQQKLNTAIIFITHDLGIVAEIAQRVVVMYAGRKVEESTVRQLFAQPKHPYTVGLMTAVPRLENFLEEESAPSRLTEIPGAVPRLYNLPAGCAFVNRCSFATDQCRQEKPPFEEKSPGHWAACWQEIGS